VRESMRRSAISTLALRLRRRARWSRGLLRPAELCGGASGGSSEVVARRARPRSFTDFASSCRDSSVNSRLRRGPGSAGVGEGGEEGRYGCARALSQRASASAIRFFFAAQASGPPTASLMKAAGRGEGDIHRYRVRNRVGCNPIPRCAWREGVFRGAEEGAEKAVSERECDLSGLKPRRFCGSCGTDESVPLTRKRLLGTLLRDGVGQFVARCR